MTPVILRPQRLLPFISLVFLSMSSFAQQNNSNLHPDTPSIVKEYLRDASNEYELFKNSWNGRDDYNDNKNATLFLKHIQAAIDAASWDEIPYYFRAKFYEKVREYHSASEDYNEFLKLNPKTPLKRELEEKIAKWRDNFWDKITNIEEKYFNGNWDVYYRENKEPDDGWFRFLPLLNEDNKHLGSPVLISHNVSFQISKNEVHSKPFDLTLNNVVLAKLKLNFTFTYANNMVDGLGFLSSLNITRDIKKKNNPNCLLNGPYLYVIQPSPNLESGNFTVRIETLTANKETKNWTHHRCGFLIFKKVE